MAWMKIDLELPDKPEVHAIAGMLNLDPDAVVGKLIRVWQWFDKHTTDGNAFGVTYALPDRISGVAGFGEAMAFVGWLEQQDKTLVMPKFDRHTSESAKARALTAKRVEKHKAKSNDQVTKKVTQQPLASALPREEKDKNRNTPHNPPRGAVGIDSFLNQCKESGEKPIPEDDPVFVYGDEVGIPVEFLRLAWRELVDRSRDSGKRYKDWRKAFRNCVRANWYKLWFIAPDGSVSLTTQGMAAQKIHREAA